MKRDEFLTQYHRLSNAETTFSAMKRNFGDIIRSKTAVALRNELLLVQRAYDEQNEQLRALQEWQKAQMLRAEQWNELKKSLEAECAAGAKAAETLARGCVAGSRPAGTAGPAG